MVRSEEEDPIQDPREAACASRGEESTSSDRESKACDQDQHAGRWSAYCPEKRPIHRVISSKSLVVLLISNICLLISPSVYPVVSGLCTL